MPTREHSSVDEEPWTSWQCPQSPLFCTSIHAHLHLFHFKREPAETNMWHEVCVQTGTYHRVSEDSEGQWTLLWQRVLDWEYQADVHCLSPPLFPSLDPDSTLTHISIGKDILSALILPPWLIQGKYASSCESISESYRAGGGSFVPLSYLKNDWGGYNEVSFLSGCWLALEAEESSSISLRNFIRTMQLYKIITSRYLPHIENLSVGSVDSLYVEMHPHPLRLWNQSLPQWFISTISWKSSN